MMNNLFSIFDPSTYSLSTAWAMPVLVLSLLPTAIWKTKMPILKTFSKATMSFKKEVKYTLKKTEKSTELIIITIFISILLMNFPALYPQIFSPTSHILVTAPLSLTFWLALMMFSWKNNTKHMLIHLTPQGTPTPLMPFMVMIETISNIIRPLTLCVRLTANLIAGHLLMTLLGNLMKNSLLIKAFSMMPPMAVLSILESAVAVIQAYVFMTLITLYMSESK